MLGTEQFDEVLYAVSSRIRRALDFLPQSLKEKTEEIRLRAELPVALTVEGKTMFLRESGQPTQIISRDIMKSTRAELEESFHLLCHNSVYAHANEISNGYIMMDGGHRAGICGTLIAGGMRDITSINIRIAREVIGCADSIARHFDGGGILIAGPPGSGKTTLLRDLIRKLSYGIERSMRITVIDSRGEISGGECCNDLGPNTDVLFSFDKALGAEIALRTMFPDIIAFDEIGTAAELKSVSDSFNAGVAVLTTAHIGDKFDILRRSVTNELIYSGAISKIVILPPHIGDEYEIISAEEF